MKAMILAAGRGERMRPLTDVTPKPLLTVAGKALIEYHLEMLCQLGITDVVINLAWLGQKIADKLGDGSKYGINISYSDESDGALETAGGIIKTLSFFDNEPFLVINGDVFLSAPLTRLPALDDNKVAHLWLVPNPAHNISGDFYLHHEDVHNRPLFNNSTSYTFSGIAMYRPCFFNQSPQQKKLALAPLLRGAAEQGLISGALLEGQWTDVGTPERLAQLNQ